MLRILIVFLGLFLVAAFPGGAMAVQSGTMEEGVMVHAGGCHGMAMPHQSVGVRDRHEGHGAPAGKSGLDCCLGTSLCRLACAAIEPVDVRPELTLLAEPEPARAADALPLKGHAVPPLLGPPRLILI